MENRTRKMVDFEILQGLLDQVERPDDGTPPPPTFILDNFLVAPIQEPGSEPTGEGPAG